MADMQNETAKVLINLTKTLIEKIEDYRFSNRITSRSEAIRRLIEEGLKHQQDPQKAPHKKSTK